ncbi:cobalamin biosynthesis protein [Lamprobacter modestohalophilus]|uniref:cobalamin biosynthesis protein n=1 Tax=Lamprobacter modestohalophilus TaxID=1064514 RepID=UPI002ADEC919|nr:cobalamin biosynthesis protein [Lamprobacter modestohalophilus]MEA1049604.1 cobalamin biosynthesis protein [Lamprobacter modestohalophilus]
MAQFPLPSQDSTGERPPTVAIGIGCMRGTALATLEAAVQAALHGLGPVTVIALASLERKRDEPVLWQLASSHGWPLWFFSADELAVIPVARPSPSLLRSIGTASVAEAAALLAANRNGLMADRNGAPGEPPQLLVQKQAHQGVDGKWVTVAVAGIRSDSDLRLE